MDIKIDKCPIPILWMDTNVIIDITKYKEGIALKGILNERIPKLYDLIYKKTRQHKLIYAEGDQNEEVNSLMEEAHRVQSSLSLGVKFRFRSEVHDEQIFLFMKAYIEKSNLIKLSYIDVFYDDPIEKIEEISQSGLIISVFSDKLHEEMEEREISKSKLLHLLEELNQEFPFKEKTFEQHLKNEQYALLQVCRYLVENIGGKLKNGQIPNIEEFNQLSILTSLMEMWANLGNGDVEGLFEFLGSELFKLIPFIDIKSKLFAKIMTRKSKAVFSSGDSMDIEQLCTVIPFSNYVITDKLMKNRVVELGLDKHYNTKVYSLSDTDEIINELEKL